MNSTSRMRQIGLLALCGITMTAMGCRSTQARRFGGTTMPATNPPATATAPLATGPSPSAVVPASYFTSDPYQAPGTCNH